MQWRCKFNERDFVRLPVGDVDVHTLSRIGTLDVESFLPQGLAYKGVRGNSLPSRERRRAYIFAFL
jgi:hypothetical protein